MKAQEFIAELGDSPAEHEPNRRRRRSLFHATVDGQWVDVFFDRSDLNGTLHITFAVNSSYDAPDQPTRASGSAVRILSTVLDIIRQRLPEYIRSARPPAVSFTARGDNRARLYRKYFVPVVQNILGSKWTLTEYPSMGMTVFNWRPSKKHDVEENSSDGAVLPDRFAMPVIRQTPQGPVIKYIDGNDGEFLVLHDNGKFMSLSPENKQWLKNELGLAENFADGRVKGRSRPGRVKRAGASCKGSVTDLRARAKKYGGERGKMYHWCANMKSGRNKK